MASPDPNGLIVVPDVFIDLCSYSGELSGWLAPTIAGALTLVLIALTVVFAIRRRRRGKRIRAQVSAASIAVVISLLVTAALTANSIVGYLPSFIAVERWLNGAAEDATVGGDLGSGSRQPTTDTASAVFQARIPATAQGVPSGNAWVYLPPGYDQHPDMRYRVIVALHGDPGKGADWFGGGAIQTTLDVLISSGALPPVVLVSPDLSAGMGVRYQEPVNLPNGPAITDYVATDVVSWVDSNVRTTGQVQDRVILGFSSGGFGSLVIGLRNTDVFGGIVSILPYTVPYTKAYKVDAVARVDWDPVDLIRDADTLPPVFLGMAGLETPVNGNKLSAALSNRDATFTKRVFQGQGHTWQTARAIAPFGLVWIANQLGWAAPIQGDMSGFPQSCRPDPNPLPTATP